MSADKSEFVLERELAFLLVDAGRKFNDAYDQKMKPLGLTRSQWRVVAYVSRTPGISQTELADSIECSRMAITSLLDRMQAKGLIERHAVEGDRRLRAVFLTDKGQSLVKEMNRTAVNTLDKVFAGTTAGDRKRLHQLLDTIKSNAAEIIASAVSTDSSQGAGQAAGK
ncbi:MAG: MarR family transcriptional regulator [Pseudomonadales bacterium]|nr:MarR family transcriptional regulator [Pseudomonadales bacterium]